MMKKRKHVALFLIKARSFFLENIAERRLIFFLFLLRLRVRHIYYQLIRLEIF